MSRSDHRNPAVDRPRKVAFDVVRAVTEQDSYANLLLPQRIRSTQLVGRDAAFATELTYGTLRWRGSYDAITSACVDRSLSDIDPAVLDLLRLGAHQIFSMNVPDHAAVATTVDLAKRNGLRGASGFVNAVLRRMARSSFPAWIDQLTSEMTEDSDLALSLRYSHPEWLVAELRRALAARRRPATELARLLREDNEPASVTLVARPGLSTVDELIAAGARPGRWSPLAAVLDGGDPAQVPAVREHRAGVQDEGSQVVGLALGHATLSVKRRDEHWLDMCAGPGGKAALLAASATTAGAVLEAWEIREHRARLVRQQVPPAVRVQVRDAGDPDVVRGASQAFDRVLLDAPCSGAGALRRRPEARWRKSAVDLQDLVRGQVRLLKAALDLTAPGGAIAYVTCSPLVDETSQVVETVLRASDQFSRLDARQYLPVPMSELGSGPYVQLWPHLHGTDAMFLALLRRHG